MIRSTPIRPYPRDLEEQWQHRGQRLLLRPIRPEDAAPHRRFLVGCEAEDLRLRFAGIRALSEADVARLTRIDYDREMAFVATTRDGSGAEAILGIARAYVDADGAGAELAVLVRSDLKRQGLGTLLLKKLIHYCRERGTPRLWGAVLAENGPMLHLARSLGFKLHEVRGGIAEIRLDL